MTKMMITKKLTGIFAAAMLLLAAMLPAGVFAGQDGDTGEPLHIVAAIFPEYDWVKQILGENPGNAQVTLLLDQGVDLHSFQPSAQDILTISTCDLFLYVGGPSDEWVEDVLSEAMNPDMQVISLLDVLGDQVREEELAEGMQEEPGDEEEPEPDEHVWLSLRNASVFVDAITEALTELDPAHTDLYHSNAEAYRASLQELDEAYEETVSNAQTDTLIFGDRFPFLYMVEDYGLSYYAAFAGCSAETEASFETIIFLAGKIDELDLHAILVLEGADPRIAETIRSSTSAKDQKILTMDSLQSVTTRDEEAGVTYLSVMESNRKILQEALQ